jgi:hypothetical protein
MLSVLIGSWAKADPLRAKAAKVKTRTIFFILPFLG